MCSVPGVRTGAKYHLTSFTPRLFQLCRPQHLRVLSGVSDSCEFMGVCYALTFSMSVCCAFISYDFEPCSPDIALWPECHWASCSLCPHTIPHFKISAADITMMLAVVCLTFTLTFTEKETVFRINLWTSASFKSTVWKTQANIWFFFVFLYFTAP